VTTLRPYLLEFARVLIYLWIVSIFARAMASWFVRDWSNPIMRFLVDVTEPILGPLRRVVPSPMGVDFSPMVAILALYLVSYLLPVS
jgi:YggT family protein